jgi:hypothetical protein
MLDRSSSGIITNNVGQDAFKVAYSYDSMFGPIQVLSTFAKSFKSGYVYVIKYTAEQNFFPQYLDLYNKIITGTDLR